MDQYRAKAKTLSIIWIASFIILGVISFIYIIYQRVVNNYNPITMLSGYQLFSLVIMLIYFMPMLLVIRRYSKLAHMTKLRRIAGIAYVFIAIWATFLSIFTVISVCFPGLLLNF